MHARDVVAQIFRSAIARGQKVENPGDGVSAPSITVFAARERSPAPQEIRVFFEQLERVSTLPTTRLALRLIFDAGSKK
jgi:hypothetical protein